MNKFADIEFTNASPGTSHTSHTDRMLVSWLECQIAFSQITTYRRHPLPMQLHKTAVVPAAEGAPHHLVTITEGLVEVNRLI